MVTNPIKYYGGKNNGLAKIIVSHFPSEGMYDTYVEAYGGGAACLFAAERVPIEIYNDIEENVYSLFKVISNPELFQKFKEMCDIHIYSRQLHEEYRSDLKRNGLSLTDRAFKYFYVNRTSYNGCGGFTANLTVRRNMAKGVSDMLSAVDSLPDIHERLSKVIVEKKDGVELIEKFDKENVFMYLDPPYEWSTRGSARYKEDMDDAGQIRLIETLLAIKHAKILLSGYDCELYQRLVDSGWKRLDIDVKTRDNANVTRMKKESLWKNY